MNATEILKLLAAKHSDDVFVPECKNGPSAGSKYVRLDAWAMRRSWSKPTTFGYEIKVSRSDFLRDEKWRAYLEMCSDFYFVCPYGIIQPEELPHECGLIWVSKVGESLFTKRKAPSRGVKISENLFRYVLMARAKISDEMLPIDYWKNWLIQKEENQRLGHEVSQRIAKLAGTRIRETEAENEILRRRQKELEESEAAFVRAGINYRAWNKDEEAMAFQRRMDGMLSSAERYSIRNAHQALGRVLESFGGGQ